MRPSRPARAGWAWALALCPAAFAGPPAQLAFTSPPQQLTAGECSAPVVLELRDDGGVPATAAADLAIDLAGFPSFYAEGGAPPAGCAGAPITQVTIDAGGGGTSFGMREPVAGRYTVSASAAGLAGAAQEVVVVPGVPGALTFVSGPFAVDAGECSPAVAFAVIDRFGNASPPDGGLTVSAGAGGARARLYADPGCATPFAPVTIQAPSSGAALYFQGSVPESFVLSVSAAGVTGADQLETVRVASADLVLTVTGDRAFTGSELTVHAAVTNTGTESLTGTRLRLDAEGISLGAAGPRGLPAIPAGTSTELYEAGIITAAAGAEVVVRGRVENGAGDPLGPEVTARTAVTPMMADLGGCGGCGAGAGGLAAAGAAAALALLGRPRRRGPTPRPSSRHPGRRPGSPGPPGSPPPPARGWRAR